LRLKFGTQKHRDQGFDQSVDVLMDKLSQVTGQPLTTEQAKAVYSNSRMRMPTAAKVFIIVSIAAGAAFAAWGAYRVSHPPSLPTLQQPTFP